MARSKSVVSIPGLECSLCCEVPMKPKILTCSHAFCDDCLTRLYQCQSAPAQLFCPICRQSTKLITEAGSKPKPMPKPKTPLKATDTDFRAARRLCVFCDPSSLSSATSNCRSCGAFMCTPCAEDHASTMEHVVKRLFLKPNKSTGSADLSQWREELEARRQADGAKKFLLTANGNPTSARPLSTTKVVLQKGFSFPPFTNSEENWILETVNTFRPSGREVWCMNPAEDNGMAVGYLDGGVRIFNVDGPRKTILKHISIQGFVTLSDGRYVVRDNENRIKIFYPDGRRAAVAHNTTADGGFGGLGIDGLDNIYIGQWKVGRIGVMRPQGGDIIREIPCHGYEPWDVCPMNHSKMIVVSGGSMVGIIDDLGQVKHEISHFGEDAHPAVLRDDRILIGWLRGGVMNIDLYTKELKHERSVLVGFSVDNAVSNKCCIREYASGEVALADLESFTVFRKIIPPTMR